MYEGESPEAWGVVRLRKDIQGVFEGLRGMVRELRESMNLGGDRV